MTQKEKTQELLKEFGEKIRKYRWDHRLSIDDLSKKAGVSAPTLMNFEKNNFENTSIKKIMDIASVLGIQISLKIKDLSKVKDKIYVS